MKRRGLCMDLRERLRGHEAIIAVIGLGYVGLPLAVEMAKAGFTVLGIERNPDRVAHIKRGENYIGDVDPSDLGRVVAEGRLSATTSFGVVSDVDVISICVPTPLDQHKQPDMTYIEDVMKASCPYLHKEQLIVLESTTYPGTTQEVIQPRIESRGLVVGQDIYLAFSPERVDPGNAKYRTHNTPKVVGGVTPHCTDVAKTLYESVLHGPVLAVSSPKVAEMSKLLENIFRIVNISLVNELAMLCERMGIDIWEVIDAAKTKPFGFMPFYPGPGVGGHCIPLDPFYLSWKAREYDFATRFIELAGDISQSMPYKVTQRISELLSMQGKSVRGAEILLLGMAYKADIDDVRESPALKIAELLLERGAQVRYHDPFVRSVVLSDQVHESVPLTEPTLKKADLVVITTGHATLDYTWIVDTAEMVFDTRNAASGLSSPTLFRLGAPLVRSDAGETPTGGEA